jgi:hypothetical protein
MAKRGRIVSKYGNRYGGYARATDRLSCDDDSAPGLAPGCAMSYTFLLETFGSPMPPPASQVDWEMTMVMPLGALANQLVKIEGDLRFLSMKAAEYSGEDGVRSTKAIDARLELIHEALQSISSLLVRLQADIHPKGPAARSAPHEPAVFSTRKPSPERDD